MWGNARHDEIVQDAFIKATVEETMKKDAGSRKPRGPGGLRDVAHPYLLVLVETFFMYPPAAQVAPHPLVLARDLRRRPIELVAPPANCWENGPKNGVIQLQSGVLFNSALTCDRA
jgi:hypothetical protein